MSLPLPDLRSLGENLRRQLAQSLRVVENVVDQAVAPIENMLAQAGLPTPPKPVKLSQLVEQAQPPPLPLPGAGQGQAATVTVEKIVVETQPKQPIEAQEATMISPVKPSSTPAREVELEDVTLI